MAISLSEQLESDIKEYLHKTFGTYFSSLDERFAADIKEDVINTSDFHHGFYNDDDISIAFQRVTLGRMGHPDWQIYHLCTDTEANTMKQNVKVNTPIHIRPASHEEAGLFYSQMKETEDAALGTVGHVRMDFGSSGKGFYHTWWPHNDDQFNTKEFKGELQEVVDALRADGPLKDLASMRSYCYRNGGELTEDGRCYGYVVDTEHYRYCLRCTPSPGDYQGYLYCYDLRQQQMAQQNRPVGRVTFTNGEQMEYLDGETYLTAIREELPYVAATGFHCETLTDDPTIRKAVDDILLDFGGEANPRRECNYGLTEKGTKALLDAADPSLSHSYSWFVITDCNTQEEEFHRDLTLSDAILIYCSSNRPEKRIGVTKDGIATVDLVHTQDGEQRFFEDYQKLNGFQNDPEILEAVDRLRQELELPNQGMSMGGM